MNHSSETLINKTPVTKRAGIANWDFGPCQAQPC